MKGKEFLGRMKHGDAVAILLVIVSVVLLFADALLFSSRLVLTSNTTDVFLTFFHQRSFAAAEILKGNLPHWNPYIFSGSPFSLDPEPAMFYPLHVIYLLFPVHYAINLDITLHFILLGTFVYLWVSRQGIGWIASLVSAFLVMFGGAYYMHFYAGHLGILATSAWAPLILLSLDKMHAPSFPRVSLGWFLVGSFAAAMSLFAGQMQYVIISGLMAGAYALFLGFSGERQNRYRPILMLACCYVFAFLLAAIQVLPAYDGMMESYRTDLSPQFLASFSFHPENLITIVAPHFFGNMDTVAYWGREYLWEESFFVGVGGLTLICLGMYDRKGQWLAFLAFIFLILALGAHTPLFWATSKIPVLDKMRGHGKFIFGAMLPLALLGARGAASLFSTRTNAGKVIPAVFLFVGFFCGAVAYGIGNFFSLEEWREIMSFSQRDPLFVSYAQPGVLNDPAHVLRAQSLSAVSLYNVAGKSLILAVLFFARRYATRVFSCLVVLMALFELVTFAIAYKRTFPADAFTSPDMVQARHLMSDGERWLDPLLPNRAMTERIFNVSGYNSRIESRRYHEYYHTFLLPATWETNGSGLVTDQYHLSPLLRLTHILVPAGGTLALLKVADPPMPRFLFMEEYEVHSASAEIFSAMKNPGFDPWKRIILEQEPSIKPLGQGKATGVARIIEEDTDHMIIEATLTKPEILLVTDAYSRHWRAFSLEGSIQAEYEVLPANYVLRAIPLSAGHHRFVLEFSPRSFEVGKWISSFAWLVFIAMTVWCLCRQSFFKKLLKV